MREALPIEEAPVARRRTPQPRCFLSGRGGRSGPKASTKKWSCSTNTGQISEMESALRPGKAGMTLRRRSDSNRWIEVLQTSALPLGYAAFKLKRSGLLIAEPDPVKSIERETRLELATFTLAR